MTRVSRVAAVVARGCAWSMALLLGWALGDNWRVLVDHAWTRHWALGATLALVPAWLLATLLARRWRA